MNPGASFTPAVALPMPAVSRSGSPKQVRAFSRPSVGGVIALDAQRHEVAHLIGCGVTRKLAHFRQRVPHALESHQETLGGNLLAPRLAANLRQRVADAGVRRLR